MDGQPQAGVWRLYRVEGFRMRVRRRKHRPASRAGPTPSGPAEQWSMDFVAKIEAWLRDYKQRRSHSSLGDLTPDEFAADRQEKRLAIGGANF
jgi:transposase InsO family protein